MEGDTLTALTTILDIGWPALVTLGLIMLWREYKARTDQIIDSLRDDLEKERREREILLGLILDRSKLEISQAGLKFPRQTELDGPSNPLSGGD